MGLKWYHITLFVLAICAAAYFAIPSDTQMSVLEARSGRLDESAVYLTESIGREAADWEDIEEFVQRSAGGEYDREATEVLADYMAKNPEQTGIQEMLAGIQLQNRELQQGIITLETLPVRNAEQQTQLTQLYVQAGQLDKAIELLRQDLANNPTDTNLLASIATYQSWLNQPEAEAQTLEQIYALTPAPSLLDRLLDTYIWLGNRQSAKKKADDALLRPNIRPETLRKARTFFISTAEAAHAIQAAEAICSQTNTLFSDYIILAQLQDWTGNTRAAIDTLQQGLQRFPDQLQLTRFLAALYFKEEQFAATSDLLQQVAIRTDEPLDWFRAAISARDAGELQQAVDCLQHVPPSPENRWLRDLLAAETAPPEANAVQQLADTDDPQATADFLNTNPEILFDPVQQLAQEARRAFQKGDYSKAEKLFSAYLSENPDDGWAWYELGEILFQSGHDGLNAMLKAVHYLPEDGTAPIYILHAATRDRQGRMGQAEALYKKAVQADTNNVDVICDYADFLLRHRKLDASEELIQDALQRFPTYLRLNRLQALVLIERGRYRQAVTLLRELFAEHPHDYELEGDLAYAEDINGNWEQAIEYFNQAALHSSLIPREADRTAAFRRRANELEMVYSPELLYTYHLRRSEAETVDHNVLAGHVELTERIRLQEFYERQQYDYHPAEETEKRSSSLNQVELAAVYSPLTTLRMLGALLPYEQDGDAFIGWRASVDWQLRAQLSLQGRYAHHYPWDDNIFALIYTGHYTEWAATAYIREIPRLGILADYSHKTYDLARPVTTGVQDPGHQEEYGVRLEYELIFSPDRTYGIGFQNGWLAYEDRMNLALLPYVSWRRTQHGASPSFTAVPITHSSENFTIGIDYYQPFTKKLGVYAGIYTGYDPKRDISFGNLYGFRGKLMYIIQNQLRLWTLYEMISENLSGLEDGETHYFYAGANWIL